MAKLIIDVSEHQGKINWQAVKPHIDGAIIRCGYGDDIKSQDDKWWTYNAAQCEKLGIPYGVYLYSYADSDAHIDSEIEHALRLLSTRKLSYPVYIDLEESAFGEYAVRAANRFCAAMERAGYYAGVYTFESFYNSFMNGYDKYTLWIAKYGANTGRPIAKPSISAKYDAWQYTSNGYISGYPNRLDMSYFYRDFPSEIRGGLSTAAKAPTKTTAIHYGRVAAAIHAYMCNDSANGYSWSPRWGEDGAGVKHITVDGCKYAYDRGSYDCSSSTITAWKAALENTEYAHALDGATYTGNMRSVFVDSGLFEWKPMSFLAEPGDLYLNEQNHVAMCQTQTPDVLSEFSSNENGGAYGGQVGDQTGREAWVHSYYSYPWDGILHYNGKADTSTETPTDELPRPEYRVYQDGKWTPYKTGGKTAGSKLKHIYDIHVRNLGPNGWFRLTLADGTVLRRGQHNNKHEQPIIGVQIYYDTPNTDKTGYYEALYRVCVGGGKWLKWIRDDSGTAGNGKNPLRCLQLKIRKIK